MISDDKLKRIVSCYFNIDIEIIISKNRKKSVVEARHYLVYLFVNYLCYPLEKSGELSGGLDHSSIISAINKLNGFFEKYPNEQKKIKDLRNLISQADRGAEKYFNKEYYIFENYQNMVIL